MTRVGYLAYPIDGNPTGRCLRLVEYFKREAQTYDAIGLLFDPGDAFTVINKILLGNKSGVIKDLNAVAASEADAVFAFLPEGIDTLGVPMEIDRAAASGKEVWLFTDRETMFMLPDGVRRYDLSEGGVNNAVQDFIHLKRELVVQEDRDFLPVKLITKDGRLPTRAHATDAGFDLYVSGSHVIEAGEFVDVPTDIAIELPDYVWGNLVGRSSTWRTHRLSVIQGVIDPGYRGPLFIGIHNPKRQPTVIEHGTRVAQSILMGNATKMFEPIVVETLNPSDRGENGFGSSGK